MDDLEKKGAARAAAEGVWLYYDGRELARIERAAELAEALGKALGELADRALEPVLSAAKLDRWRERAAELDDLLSLAARRARESIEERAEHLSGVSEGAVEPAPERPAPLCPPTWRERRATGAPRGVGEGGGD